MEDYEQSEWSNSTVEGFENYYLNDRTGNDVTLNSDNLEDKTYL